jgi:hypothetical protein
MLLRWEGTVRVSSGRSMSMPHSGGYACYPESNDLSCKGSKDESVSKLHLRVRQMAQTMNNVLQAKLQVYKQDALQNKSGPGA